MLSPAGILLGQQVDLQVEIGPAFGQTHGPILARENRDR